MSVPGDVVWFLATVWSLAIIGIAYARWKYDE